MIAVVMKKSTLPRDIDFYRGKYTAYDQLITRVDRILHSCKEELNEE
jgi:hypothetical protein